MSVVATERPTKRKLWRIGLTERFHEKTGICLFVRHLADRGEPVNTDAEDEPVDRATESNPNRKRGTTRSKPTKIGSELHKRDHHSQCVQCLRRRLKIM